MNAPAHPAAPEPPRGLAPTRRGLLKKGLVGGLLLTVGAAVPIALRRGPPGPSPRSPLRLLDEREHAILSAVAARVVPGEGAPAGWPSAEALDCAGKVDALLARTAPEVGRDFKRLLRLFDNGLAGLLLFGAATPFSALAPAAQDARLHAWSRSRVALLRSGYQAMVRLVNAAYYSSPEVYALVGYPGPPFSRPGDAP